MRDGAPTAVRLKYTPVMALFVIYVFLIITFGIDSVALNVSLYVIYDV